ncbi:MAG: alpha/beta fold hydrolase, partial [Acidimicrobiales bacterium]
LVGAGHHVVVYDERGHGASTTGSALLDVTTLSDDLRAVLDAVDAREAVVAGHSLGGMAVQCFADRHKDVLADRVAAIVLVSTASEHVIAGGAYLRLARRVVGSRLVERAVSNHAVGPFLVRGAFGRRPAMSHLLATAETFTATPAAVRQALLGAMAGLDLTAGLPALTVPTVVVSGTRDTLTLPGRSRTIVSLAPAARLEVVPGGGHQLVFEAPERLAAILAGLVSGAQHPDRKGDPS